MAIKFVKDFVQGDSFTITIRHDPVIDITDYEFVFTLKASASDTEDVFRKHVTLTPADANSLLGIALIPVTTSDTTSIPAGKYVGTLRRVDTSGEIVTLARSGLNDFGRVICYQAIEDDPGTP